MLRYYNNIIERSEIILFIIIPNIRTHCTLWATNAYSTVGWLGCVVMLLCL